MNIKENMLLDIKDLHVSIGGNEILKGIDLSINYGEVHAIMGPNGTGKSTLAAAITGRNGYEITSGEIIYKSNNINEVPADIRAKEGIFLSFQYPVEIPGVSITNFMRTALNAKREFEGLPAIKANEFLKKMEAMKKLIDIQSKLTNRSVNEGFSGGEKKKNEIFQMAMLEPTLAILDETDSGLDIDALKVVAKGVNAFRSSENAFLVITHYQRLLDFIVPDFVHVMFDGRIVKSGRKELALELEEKGYDWIKK
ncbi:MAG TPA: Fe-S cluster assembly ATPase SufC [Bacteroidales bacterium]|jgi:Fe-S cluster assembly ATP-binding protein|nr:Fe-S cluster assembly ATPase SufC [Bacteroidales bacterium]|tara:strand:+ start:529 stop:1290 length:762 start_codon:yes stop_codon:yes gene_type:complete